MLPFKPFWERSMRGRKKILLWVEWKKYPYSIMFQQHDIFTARREDTIFVTVTGIINIVTLFVTHSWINDSFSLFLKITFFFCRNVKKHFSKRIVRVGDLCISCIPVFWNCLYLINNNQKIACPLADTNLPSCVNYTSHEWAMRASDRYNQHSCFQHC